MSPILRTLRGGRNAAVGALRTGRDGNGAARGPRRKDDGKGLLESLVERVTGLIALLHRVLSVAQLIALRAQRGDHVSGEIRRVSGARVLAFRSGCAGAGRVIRN
jgi:hypothetical protein